jgi:hypothetical protein
MSSETGSKLQPATAFTFSTHGPFLIPISRAGFETALVKHRIQFSRRLIPIGLNRGEAAVDLPTFYNIDFNVCLFQECGDRLGANM